jgi:hypothetical protein
LQIMKGMNEPIHQGSGHEPGAETLSNARPRRRWPMPLLLLVLLALGTSPWWWPRIRPPTPEEDLPLPAIPEAAPGANAPLPAALTFLLVADTHLGADGMEQANAGMLAALDTLPGRPWPSPVGGVVDPPLALAVLGDLTNSGRAEQMRCFERLYYADPHARRGGTVALSGNHDHTDERQMVSGRLQGWHGYPLRAWDWGGVRMLCLDTGPTASALTWLEQELARLPAKQPLIILQHFALCGPYSGPRWVAEEHKARYAAILTGRRVLAIFHGHFHGSGHYRWQGIDVYNTGSPLHKWCEALAVHVTSDELVVASWNWQARRWWWMHRKPRDGNAPGVFTNLAGAASDPPVLDPYPLEP